ncbi:MAG TPA: FeoB small GTPase domain-containing protein, partial [Candidatus Deferrimicrobiaceae bacterium]
MKSSAAASDCCRPMPDPVPAGLPKLVLVGCPNVGKSLLFNRLTGAYVAVSNYPGTTVEVSRGKARIGEREFEVVDTPGMYSLRSLTEEERVARAILLHEEAEVVLHVVDGKNLPRMLPLTMQLIEAELPVLLVINMADETARAGIEIDVPALEQALGIPVAVTSSATGQGIDPLREMIPDRGLKPGRRIDYPAEIEKAVGGIEP